MRPMLNVAIDATRQAAKLIVRYLDQLDSVNITYKDRNDVVTEVDRLSEQTIVTYLRKAYPNHSILAEEGGYSDGDEFCWIIDPLDGTTNFIHGFPQFATSIALKHKNELQVAVVYDPVRQEMFTAARGQGAQLNSRRIRVSQNIKMQNALIGTGFPFKDMAQLKSYLNLFEQIFPKSGGVRRAGAASLDLAYVAAGRLDGFWESNLHPWDYAGGVLLIQEAGGRVSDFQGEQAYWDNGNIIAGNPKIFEQLLAIIKK